MIFLGSFSFCCFVPSFWLPVYVFTFLLSKCERRKRNYNCREKAPWDSSHWEKGETLNKPFFWGSGGGGEKCEGKSLFLSQRKCIYCYLTSLIWNCRTWNTPDTPRADYSPKSLCVVRSLPKHHLQGFWKHSPQKIHHPFPSLAAGVERQQRLWNKRWRGAGDTPCDFTSGSPLSTCVCEKYSHCLSTAGDSEPRWWGQGDFKKKCILPQAAGCGEFY